MSWTETAERLDEFAGEQLEYASESPFSPYPAAAVAEATYEYTESAGGQFQLSAGLETEQAETPFATPFTSGSAGEGSTALFAEIVAELTNPELTEALGEVVQEVSGIHAEHVALSGAEAAGTSGEVAELAAAQHLEVLAELTERYFETMAAAVGEREAATIGEGELPNLLEALESAPFPVTESPAFEQFFGALRRTIGRVVSKAVDLGRRAIKAVGTVLPLGAIIRKLKGLIRPLLKRVLGFAIRRLPVALQPVALRLRDRLFGAEVLAEDELTGEGELVAETFETHLEQAAVGEVATLENEFTAMVAEILTEAGAGSAAEDEWAAHGEWHETQLSELTGETAYQVGAVAQLGPSANELDAARIRLVNELAALRDGESAAPAFENFLPAILPVLRLGITIVGRGRVVRFLAGLLAKLLGPYVGPQLSRPLSQAIVDAGLRVLTLEAPTQQEAALAGPSALAAVAEDVARQVGALEASAFEDQARLEVETMVAFNEAVARNFPPAMLRPDLQERESATATAMWAMRPRVYWYKKYTRVFEITLDPRTAGNITTFGGVSLAAFLKSVHGVTKPVRVRVHLYETLPGTYLSRIAALEHRVPHMKPDGWRRFHPLSVQAASTLLGEPGLGNDVDSAYLRDRSHIASGQRFFYLALPVAGIKGVRPSQAFVVIDGRPTINQIRLYLYLSEADAQPIAARARQNNTTAFVIALRAAFRAAIYSLRQSPRSRVTVLRESELTGATEISGAGEAAGGAAGIGAAIGSKLVTVIVDKLIDAAIRLAMDYARAKRDEFVKQVDDPRQGVTIIVTIPAVGLSTVLRGGLLPSIAQIGALRTLIGTLSSGKFFPGMQTVAGFRRG